MFTGVLTLDEKMRRKMDDMDAGGRRRRKRGEVERNIKGKRSPITQKEGSRC